MGAHCAQEIGVRIRIPFKTPVDVAGDKGVVPGYLVDELEQRASAEPVNLARVPLPAKAQFGLCSEVILN